MRRILCAGRIRTVNGKTLFITRFLDSAHHAAVFFDWDDDCFYHVLFERVQTGGAAGYALRDKGRPVSIDTVRKLAEASEDGNAGRYCAITEENWRELVDQSR